MTFSLSDIITEPLIPLPKGTVAHPQPLANI